MPTRLTRFAKRLRRNSTDAERLFWFHIRAQRLAASKWKRQQPIGLHIVDFVCFDARLIVEIDGGQHADSAADALRDRWLQSQGFRVLRFWNNDVLKNISGVLEVVLAAVEVRGSPLPSPSPARGEG